MAKTATRRPTAVQEQKQTKKQIALSRKAARQRRIILLSAGAVALVVLVILIVGVLQEVVIKPSQPVAVVNGAKIRTAEYQDLVTYQRYNQYVTIDNLQSSLDQLQQQSAEGNEFLVSFYQQQLSQLQSQLGSIPQTALDEMIDDELVAQRAAEEGLTVTDQEVEDSIQEDLKNAFASAQEPVTGTEQLPTATPVPQKDVDDLYDTILANIKISDRSFREIVKRGLYREKLQEVLAGEVVTTGLVVNVQLIKTETEEQAQAARDRIQAGEEFGVVATEVSTDTMSAEQGGDLGWVTTGQVTARYGQSVEDQVFSLAVGEMGIVQAVDGDSMYYLVRVSDRQESGPLPESVVSERKNSALLDWLEQEKASPDVQIERMLTEDQIPPDPFLTQRATS